MDSKNNPLEEYLKQLEELDRRISIGDTNDDDLMTELNKIIEGMSKDTNADIMKVKLKFINTSDNPDPTFAHEGDSGFDIRADLKEDVIIPEGEVRIIPTGLYVEVNKGLEVQIRSRSGMAAKSSMMILNSPSTVDSGYRGEIQIILANFSDTPKCIRNGDRIAQGVVCPVYGEDNLILERVDKLSETKRNDNKFGSTGIS